MCVQTMDKLQLYSPSSTFLHLHKQLCFGVKTKKLSRSWNVQMSTLKRRGKECTRSQAQRAHTPYTYTHIHARAVVQCYHTHQTPATNMQVLQRLSGMQLDIKLLLMYGPSWLKHPQNNKHCTCCRSFKTQCSTFLSTATQISRDFLCCGTADCAVGWS